MKLSVFEYTMSNTTDKASSIETLKLLVSKLAEELPSFTKAVDRRTRRILVNNAARASFWIAIIALCFLLPLWNYLSLTRWFFRVRHHLRHDIFRKSRWIHGSRFYHSRGFKICAFWIPLTVACSIFHASGDLALITKRLGRIAVALMPPLLFLTMRPTPLPHTLYLALLPLHKWISRIVVVLSLVHTILYSWYFLATHTFIIKMKKLANIWGVVAMILFILIGITSLSGVRRYNFRLFYYTHYISTWLTVILIHYHARPPVSWYTYMNCGILVAQIIYRVWRTSHTRVSIVPVSPSIALIEFPCSDLKKKPILPSSHVRINNHYPKSFFRRFLQQMVPLQHPFTVASLPTDDMVRLIIRRGNFKLRDNGEYLVCGAFEPKIDFISKHSYKFREGQFTFQNNTPALLASPLHYDIRARRVLIVVGGSAISFGLPLLRILNFNGVTVRLIWVSRDIRDLKLLNVFKNNFEGMEIYITGSDGSEQDIQIDYIDFDDEQNSYSDAITASNSLEEPVGLNSSKSAYGSLPYVDSTPEAGLQTQRGTSHEDEVDFTQLFSAESLRSKKKSMGELPSSPLNKQNVFRKPSIVALPHIDGGEESESRSVEEEQDRVLQIPAGVKVFFGRPNLTNSDYQWCLEKECIGPTDSNDCYEPNVSSTPIDDLSQVWVTAAGPPGLVESTKRWATDGGLHFHEESFTV